MTDPVLETLFVALITLNTLARSSNALFQAVCLCVCVLQREDSGRFYQDSICACIFQTKLSVLGL